MLSTGNCNIYYRYLPAVASIFREPASAEDPVDKVPSWPFWEDLDKHFLNIDLVPTLLTDYIITWENPDAHAKK